MPLMKTILAQDIEIILDKGKPSSLAEAATQWSKAYISYASSALSKAGSLPTNAQALQGILTGAFTSAFGTLTAATAASLISQGIMTFWRAIVWVGPTASGFTIIPGNNTLTASLSAVYMDLGEKTSSDKARDFSDAFDAGAKTVMVYDTPYAQPAQPVFGPIS